MWHVNAKAAIADFARNRRPEADVRVDDRQTPAGNQPDVWVRDSGAVRKLDIAFEAQLSQQGLANLQRRNSNYKLDDILPVWLFANLKDASWDPARDLLAHDGSLRLLAQHQEAARVGPLRFLNPGERLVATGFLMHWHQAYAREGEIWGSTPPPRFWLPRQAKFGDGRVHLSIDKLEDCELDADGFHTPTDAVIAHARREAAEEEERLRAEARQAYESQKQAAKPLTQPPPSSLLSSPPSDDQLALFVTPRRALSRPQAVWSPSAPPNRDATQRPCPACGGQLERRETPPDWYRPPKTAACVLVCGQCQHVAGSI